MKGIKSRRLTCSAVTLLLTLSLAFIFACASKKTGSSFEARKGVKINELTELKVDDKDDMTLITIMAQQDISPNVFKLTDPLRVIIDLTDTRLGEVKGPISINNGTLNEITTSQFDDVTSSLSRIVIGFDQPVDYKVTPKSGSLLISVAKKPGEVLPDSESLEEVAKMSADETTDAPAEVPAEISEMPEPMLEDELPQMEEAPSASPMEEPVIDKETQGEEIASEEELPLMEESEELPLESGNAETTPVKMAKNIEDIQFETSDMGTTVYVTADGDISDWDDFVIENPTRLVLDIKGLKKGFKGRQKIDVGSTEVDKLRFGEYKDKVRIVLDYPANQKPSYTINKEEKGWL